MSARAPAVVAVAALALVSACESVRTEAPPVRGPTASVAAGGDGRAAGEGPARPAPVPSEGAGAREAPEGAPARPPAAAARAAGGTIHSVEGAGPYVAMTFDDGPHPVQTPRLLDMLKARGIRATFYVVGKNVEAYPEIARQIVREGHEIANHTWDHPSLTRLSPEGVRGQIVRTNDAIYRATGVRARTMRPPYGATNAAINRRMNEEFGLPVIMWSVDPLDWKYRNATRVAGEIVSKARPGGIVLAHDIHATTVAAMPAALDGLRKRGLRFVTVSELLAMEGGARALRDAIPARVAPEEPEATPFQVRRVDEAPVAEGR